MHHGCFVLGTYGGLVDGTRGEYMFKLELQGCRLDLITVLQLVWSSGMVYEGDCFVWFFREK